MPRLLPLVALSIGLIAVAGCGDSGDAETTTPAAQASTQLDTAKVETAIQDSIEQQRSVKATVSCPESVVQAKGRDFVCVARTKDRKRTNFAVQQVDDAGNVTYAAARTN